MRLKSQCFSSPRYLSQCTMHLAKNKNTSVEEMVNQPFFNNLGQIFQEFSRAKLKKQQHFCLGVGWIRLILPFLHHIASSAVAVQVIHNCFMLRMVSPPKKRPISIPSQILEYPYKKLIFPKGIFFFRKNTTSTARTSEGISTHFWDIHAGVGYVSIVYIYARV